MRNRTDGTVECWGKEGTGLGDAPDGRFVAISAGWKDTAGFGHSCGLRDDGTIVCWGFNAFGATSAPEGQFEAVSAGRFYSCGLRADGTITCWGESNSGQAVAPDGRFTTIASGSWHSCGLRIDSTIKCWGSDFSGEAEAPIGQFSSVSAGTTRSCGVRVNGTVACWGYDHASPTEAPDGQFTAVTTGPDHACGLRADRTAECWGRNDRGQAAPLFGRFTKIDAGDVHSCGLRTDNSIVCWGISSSGEADAPDGQFIDVAVTSTQSCGVGADGTIACWGNMHDRVTRALRGRFSAIDGGAEAMCGVRADLTVTCRAVAEGLADTPSGDFSAVSAGDRHACGLRVDGSVVCWGDNSHGQTDTPSGDFSAVSAGDRHACGLRVDGSVVCWGDNTHGQTDAPDGPFQVISASRSYTCGLDAGNRIKCWGLAHTVPLPAGVDRAARPDSPDPRECRPFGTSYLSPGFPLSKDVPSTTGRLRVAVLFVDFPNAPALNSAQQESLKGLSYLKQYLESASYRTLRIDFVPLYRWLRAERSYSHYVGPVATGPDHISRGIDREVVRLVDPDFDFTGVGAVMIVMPSAHFAGGNASGSVETEEGPASTLRVNTALSASTSNWGPTAAHELAHNLGLADLYPYTANQHFVPTIPPPGKRWRHVTLGLMGLTAAVPVNDRDPSGFTIANEMLAWSRWQLGWLDDDQVHCVEEEQATVELSPVADPGDGIAMAAVSLSSTEAIVLESRRRVGYDEHAALGDGRVVVYTVESRLGSGDLPIKLAGDTGRGHTLVNPILGVGESVTVRGYTITVVADDGDTHTVTITKDAEG